MIRNLVLGFLAVVAALVVMNNPGIITKPFYQTLDTLENPSKYEDSSPVSKLIPEPSQVPSSKAKTRTSPQERPGGFGAGAVAIQRAQGL